MALGTLVLGYCLMQFDNGTASRGLSWLSVGMTMMCIAGYDERRASGVDPVL